MTTFLYIVFALSVFAPIYTYIIYPLLLKALAVIFNKQYKRNDNFRPTVSILVAAYNEEKIIAEKIKNFCELDYPPEKIEFVIASDGSSDKTVEVAKGFSNNKNNIKVLNLARGGKVNALNSILKQVKGEILVFSDANTMFDQKAILNLVKYFTDDQIGCVSGQLRYKMSENAGHGAKSESTYWKYENWVKILESKLGRLSGANGAIYSIRRDLIKKIPNDIINDDFYIATNVMQLGYDVILEPEAIAYEEPNDEFDSQFKRHIRDGAGHYQAMAVFWRMLFFRKGSFVYVSHRVIKWLVPFLLVTAFITNGLLVSQSIMMKVFFLCQVTGYLALLFYYIGLKKWGNVNNSRIGKLLTIIFYFFSVNLALLVGFIKFIRKQQQAIWETQR